MTKLQAETFNQLDLTNHNLTQLDTASRLNAKQSIFAGAAQQTSFYPFGPKPDRGAYFRLERHIDCQERLITSKSIAVFLATCRYWSTWQRPASHGLRSMILRDCTAFTNDAVRSDTSPLKASQGNGLRVARDKSLLRCVTVMDDVYVMKSW
jgi:hypothetical protein